MRGNPREESRHAKMSDQKPNAPLARLGLQAQKTKQNNSNRKHTRILKVPLLRPVRRTKQDKILDQPRQKNTKTKTPIRTTLPVPQPIPFPLPPSLTRSGYLSAPARATAPPRERPNRTSLFGSTPDLGLSLNARRLASTSSTRPSSDGFPSLLPYLRPCRRRSIDRGMMGRDRRVKGWDLG